MFAVCRLMFTGWRLSSGVKLSDVSCLPFDVWCMLSDVWCLLSDVWCLLSDLQHLPSDLWRLPSNIWCLPSDVWQLSSAVWFLLFDVWYLPSDVWYLLSDVWYLPSDVWCLPSDVWCLPSDIWWRCCITWIFLHYVFSGDFQRPTTTAVCANTCRVTATTANGAKFGLLYLNNIIIWYHMYIIFQMSLLYYS